MNFNRLLASFRKSLNLPEEAQCLGTDENPGCGFFDIMHPEVRKILTEAGYTLEQANATVQCHCGTEEQKAAKQAEIAKVKATYLGAGGRGSFAVEHARGITSEDQRRENRRGR